MSKHQQKKEQQDNEEINMMRDYINNEFLPKYVEIVGTVMEKIAKEQQDSRIRH